MDFFLWFQPKNEQDYEGALLLISCGLVSVRQFLNTMGFFEEQISIVSRVCKSSMEVSEFGYLVDFDGPVQEDTVGYILSFIPGLRPTIKQQAAIEPICRNVTDEDEFDIQMVRSIVNGIQLRRRLRLEGNESAVCVACSEDLLPEQQSLLVLPPGYKPVSENLLRDDAHCGTSALHLHMRRPY